MFRRAKTLLVNPTSYWNNVLKEEKKVNKFAKNHWYPQTKKQKENFKADPKGTKKVHSISQQDKQYILEIFAFSKSGQMEQAFDTYHKLKKGLADVRVFTVLIKCCNKPEYISEAFDVYQDMKKSEIKPSLATFQTLLNVCITNQHLERGMYVVKEYLAQAGKRNTPQVSKFFYSALKLAYQKDAPGRAYFLYETMKSRKMVNDLDFNFVSHFIKDKVHSEKFLNEMLKIKNPNHVSINIVDDLFQGLDQSLPFGISSTFAMEMEVMTSNLHKFQVETGNPNLDDYYNKVWEGLYRNGFSDVNHTEYPFPLDPPKLKEMRSNLVKDLQNAFGDDIASEKVMNQFGKERKSTINHKHSKLIWKPVIFTPHDTTPFYPKTLSIDLVNERTVREAKLEYLDTIQDIDIREEIEKDLNERITIHWLNENNELIEGIKH